LYTAVLGIDIGSKTIKIIELEKSGASYSLIASGVVGYSGSTVDKMTDEKEIASLAQIIKKLCLEARVTSKDAVISIPEPLAFTRTIKFPPLTDSEISTAIKWEAEQYIPIPVAEAVTQHTILKRKDSPPDAGVIVLLVAAPRATVEKYVKVVQLAGLNTIAVETELIALTRSLAPPDKTVLLADLGGSSTNLAIVNHGLLSFSRSLPVAGDAFTRAVSQTLSVTPQQAEEYKKAYGLSSSQLEGKIKGALDSIVRLVADEIKKAVSYYMSEEKAEAPTTLIMTGGSSGMPDIITALSNVVGMEVLVGNPFTHVQIDPAFAQKLAPFAPLYGVAVGLAMRSD
jgi:type IV pilus assembly protein PilM